LFSMSEAPDIPREMQIVGELAEMDLVAAKIALRALQDAEGAEDRKELVEAAKTYRELSRNVRMSLALREQMVKDRRPGAADAEVEKRLWRERDHARIEKRKEDLRTALHRIIWCETEGEKADYLCDLLEERLELHGRSPAFGANTLDDHVRAFCDSFGFPPGSGNDWRKLPDPDWLDGPDARGPDGEDDEPEFEASG
jgi:hypothetical protein